MTVTITASQIAIILSIMMILVAPGPSDLSDKSSKSLECNEDGPGTSFCSLSSWFQKIKDPSFECSKQEFDATGGISILSNEIDSIN